MLTRNLNDVLLESVIIELATLSNDERSWVQKCRGSQNRLGFCYQLMFVKVFNCFPNQDPLDIQKQVLMFAALHTDTAQEQIQIYQKRQQTISEHQIKIRQFLDISSFDSKATNKVARFIRAESQKTELLSILLAKAENFLREQHVLLPAQNTLERLIVTQRQKARQYIFDKILTFLTDAQQEKMDALLLIEDTGISKLQQLKQPPAATSPKGLLALINKLEIIQETALCASISETRRSVKLLSGGTGETKCPISHLKLKNLSHQRLWKEAVGRLEKPLMWRRKRLCHQPQKLILQSSVDDLLQTINLESLRK